MGLLQATSTQNDYVTALWLIILADFILYACQEEPGWAGIFSISGALGLGLLTKGTFYSFAIPWGIWLIIHWIKQRRFFECSQAWNGYRFDRDYSKYRLLDTEYQYIRWSIRFYSMGFCYDIYEQWIETFHLKFG